MLLHFVVAPSPPAPISKIYLYLYLYYSIYTYSCIFPYLRPAVYIYIRVQLFFSRINIL